MANIVLVTDFKGEIALPQPTNNLKTEKICLFITEYEPLFLKYALGDYLCSLVADWTDAGLAQKWKDLRDGVTYTVGTETRTFEGMKPLIRRYVYSYYMEDEHQTTTTVGVKKEKAANSDNTDLFKSVRQWNKMSDGVNRLWDCLNDRVDGDGARVYAEWEVTHSNIDRFRPKNLLNI